MQGKLVVICGSMFSGKSTETMRLGERHIIAGDQVVYCKPRLDNRYSETEIVNHNGRKVKAINLDTKNPKLNGIKAHVILIDEFQFFEESIIREVKKQVEAGTKVYISGLDMDYQGNPFKTIIHAMGIADEVYKLKAVCKNCGADATFSYRKVKSNEVVLLGSEDSYMPLCRDCYKEISNG